MPLMTGRTVGFDLAAQANMNALRIGVAFDVPYPATPAPHQYSIPLSMYLFPATGQQNPSDPLPENAALPFVPVRAQYGATTKTTNFLLDTGAQQCILSEAMALELGLDLNDNGTIDDEAISFQTVAGVGGAIEIPVVRIDALSLRTANDTELLFRDITVGVIDIDPALPGVLGMNVLNSGWEIHALNTFLGIDPGPPGVFSRVDLDFRSTSALQGEMRLTLDSARDTLISQGPLTLSVASGSQTQAQAGHAVVGGPGSITKTGAGTLVLDGVNTLTGTTVVRGGTLEITTPNALFGSPTLVEAGARLLLGGTAPARLPSVTLAGGTLEARALAVTGSGGLGRLTVESGQVVGSPTVTVGIAGSLRLSKEIPLDVSLSSLVVDEEVGGFVDLGRGRLQVAAGGVTRAALVADLLAGRAGGTWAGEGGITSTATAEDVGSGLLRSIGWIETADGGMVVGYAAPGDTNVDGLVDILDIAGFLGGNRFDSWAAAICSEGDFNYDSVVDILDAADLAATELFDRGESRSPAAGMAVAVPEPGGFGVLVVAAMLSALGIVSRSSVRVGPLSK